MVKKSLFGIIIFLIITFAVAPIILYSYSIRLVDTMPNKAENQLSQIEVNELWKSLENCNPKDCSSTTPYWVYRWLFVAMINDFFSPVDLESVYANMSKMASKIAIHHMRNGHFKGQGMGWWHLTHTCLSIWIQRNWEAGEIAAKYRSINA